eukprot:scaffold2072_cov126-Isochrysis_galbana.AAC.8
MPLLPPVTSATRMAQVARDLPTFRRQYVGSSVQYCAKKNPPAHKYNSIHGRARSDDDCTP